MSQFNYLSDKEFFNMFGTLDEARIIRMLDVQEACQDLDEVKGCIKEGMSGFSEDAFSGVLKDLSDVAKRLRGDNKLELLRICEDLENVAQGITNSVDYDTEKLQEAIVTLTNAGF